MNRILWALMFLLSAQTWCLGETAYPHSLVERPLTLGGGMFDLSYALAADLGKDGEKKQKIGVKYGVNDRLEWAFPLVLAYGFSGGEAGTLALSGGVESYSSGGEEGDRYPLLAQVSWKKGWGKRFALAAAIRERAYHLEKGADYRIRHIGVSPVAALGENLFVSLEAEMNGYDYAGGFTETLLRCSLTYAFGNTADLILGYTGGSSEKEKREALPYDEVSPDENVMIKAHWRF